ncbi:efflux RND transporter periplasmic adaptor subunit [Agrobacterium sp. a22-2]|uniref:efflux RND transporter periplasmic adaptor subunit n=1 Tax=Agrobacterium sp. a22-2 TaxID=2283840 RepID=UPI0014466B0A|nr:efflux RND transporter periplasmic adaptor subunit [Agrobacterium sp. a22-2]NKN35930.1 efflux RND transporter periplasmic adaptor subunit [Agrobacterium sp. a22-2]
MRRLVTNALLAFLFVPLTACAPQEKAHEKEVRHVETVVVKTEPLSETISTTGEISARVQSDLSFRTSGRIIERLVDVGDRVKAGQVLARIDAEEQKADLEVALANLLSDEAQLTEAQQAFDRQERLFATGVTTRAALDEARETLLRAQATVQSAQADVDTANDTLGHANLEADAAGIITARNAEVGQVAQAAQLIFTLAHDGPRDAVLDVNESALLGRQLEDDVEVRLLSGGEALKASVREVSPTIDTTKGTIRVKLALEGAPDVRLGSAVVATARYKPVTTIELPWSAMASAAGQPAVWIIDPKTRAVSIRPVKVLAYGAERFFVQSGLNQGEIVVSNGTKFLSDGEVVAFEEAIQ